MNATRVGSTIVKAILGALILATVVCLPALIPLSSTQCTFEKKKKRNRFLQKKYRVVPRDM